MGTLAGPEGLHLVVEVDFLLAGDMRHVGGARHPVRAVAGRALHDQVLFLGLVEAPMRPMRDEARADQTRQPVENLKKSSPLCPGAGHETPLARDAAIPLIVAPEGVHMAGFLG